PALLSRRGQGHSGWLKQLGVEGLLEPLLKIPNRVRLQLDAPQSGQSVVFAKIGNGHERSLYPVAAEVTRLILSEENRFRISDWAREPPTPKMRSEERIAFTPALSPRRHFAEFCARILRLNSPPAPPRRGATPAGQFPSWEGSGVGWLAPGSWVRVIGVRHAVISRSEAQRHW